MGELALIRLFHIECLVADNTSSNTGHISGLRVLLEGARSREFRLFLDNHPGPWRYVEVVFKGCDDHIINLIHANFSRCIVAFAEANTEFGFLKHLTNLGNVHATPYYVLKQVAHRLRTAQRPQWNALRAKLPHPAQDGTCYAKCSFGRFATFGATASAHVHYEPHTPGVRTLLTPDQIALLNNVVIAFIIRLIATFSATVERPFLKATHDLKRTQVSIYRDFRDGYVKGLEEQMRATVENPIEHNMTQMLLQSALDTLDKHNIAASASEDVTIETTNRAGETYFRYSREEMGKNRRMKSLLMWAYMTCKLSKYGSSVSLDSSHVRWAQELLQDPTKQYKYVGTLRLAQAERDEMIREAKEKVFKEEKGLLDWLYAKHMIAEQRDTLTVDVMKEALRWLKKYWGDLGFTIGGNREQLKDRLMDLRKTWDQRSDPTIPHDSDLLDPYGESDADWSDIEG